MQVSGVQVWPGERRITAGQTVVRWPLVIKTDKTLVVPVPLVGLKLDQNGPKLLFFSKNHHLTAGMGIKARGK